MNRNNGSFYSQLLSGKWFPILLLILMLCTYAVQIPQLGFYLDDWVSIAAYDQGGEEGLIAYGINDSRPFSAWVTAKFFSVLGTGTLQWQIITVFWRFAAALASWWLLKTVWPEHKKTAGMISLLFGVFPYFKHQPICIAYFMILLQYFTVILSFCFTVKALLSGTRGGKILFFVLSYAASLFHLACLEYYLSLEGARLFLIFFVLRKRDGEPFRKTVKKALLTYIPYALILVFILLYRFIYIPSLSEDVREISAFSNRKGSEILWYFGSLFIQYLSESLLGVWYRSINPEMLDLSQRHTQLAAVLGLAAGLFTLAVTVFCKKGEETDEHDTRWEMLVFGAAAMILGFFPGMMINASPAAAGAYSDRYLIPSFWGIAIFTVTWMSMLFRSVPALDIVFSAMICLSVFFQIQNAYGYRYSWKYQQKFQWQMKERIPDLEKNTAVISDGVVSLFMGGWADGSMLFEMYGKHEGLTPTPYWYFNRGEDNYFSGLWTGDPIYISSKMFEFETAPENVVVITKPEYGKCAWLLTEEDRYNPYLEDGMHDFIRYQNKSRIITDSDHVMPASIFGSRPPQDWCLYFERADLAYDMEDYDTVLRLYDEAAAKGLKWENAVEMRPFIKAAAAAGDWDKALEWTETANAVRPDQTTAYFNNLWTILERDVPDSDAKKAAMEKARTLFGTE